MINNKTVQPGMEANSDGKDVMLEEGKQSRPGSSDSKTSLKSAIKIYSGLKFFDIKRSSSRSSVKSRGSVTSRSASKTSREGNSLAALCDNTIKLSKSTSHLGSISTLKFGNSGSVKLGSSASIKLGRISSRQSSKAKPKQLTPNRTLKTPFEVEQRPIDFRTEVNFLFSCDLCTEDDKNKPANGFCTICNQYMCADCLVFHQRVNATKSHSILIGAAIQKRKVNTSIVTTKCSCPAHPGEILRYFCNDHEACICEKCKFIQHHKCAEIGNIYDLAAGIHESKETRMLLGDIDTILAEFKHLKHFRKADIEEIIKQKDGIINAVSAIRQQINELLDKIESDTIRTFSESIDEEIGLIEKQTETFDNIIPLLESYKDNIISLQKNAEEEELFLAVKKAKIDIRRYCDVLVETHKDSYKFNIKFEANETVKELYQSMESLGLVRIKKFKTGCVLPSLSLRPHSNREALFAGEINVYFQTDTVIPSIYKTLELPNGDLISSDRANRKVKLFDHTHKAICEMTLTSEPKGMTFLPPSEILVALNNEKCLQRIVLNDTGLLLGRKCFTKLCCIDLVTHDKMIIALAENKAKFFITVMDAKGHVQKCIRQESKKTGIFTDVTYIAKNREGTVVYISDSVSGCIALSMSGDIHFHITDETLDNCRGISVNPEGGLYIVGCHSNNIVLFSDKGEKVKDIIVKNLFSPWSILYSALRNQLMVSYTQANTIKLFTLL